MIKQTVLDPIALEKLIEAAANWWADAFIPLHKSKNHLLLRFKVMHFKRKIKNYLRNCSEKMTMVQLFNDTIPEWPLSAFCKETELSHLALPANTTMWVFFERNFISVLMGDYAPLVQVYPIAEEAVEIPMHTTVGSTALTA